MGHSNIRSTMDYTHVAKIKLSVKNIRFIYERRKIRNDKNQKILGIGLEKYLEENKTIVFKQKVIKAIKNCKSDKLEAHKYVCDECEYEEIGYNSYRNRHCLNCQKEYIVYIVKNH